MQFGEKLRELRESQGLLQRQLAASLEIDTPMFSKIERGERRAKREQVERLASLLHANKPVSLGRYTFSVCWTSKQVGVYIRPLQRGNFWLQKDNFDSIVIEFFD